MDPEEEIGNPYIVFPEEVWEIIFSKVAHFEDVWNIRQTYFCWDVLLNKSRQDWMFEKMIPHVFQYLDISSVLNCRLVSRRWNAGVIRFLNNEHPSLCPVTIPPVSLAPSPFRLFDGLVIDQENISKLHSDLDLRDHFRLHPYPSRQVSIDWHDDDDEDEVPSDDDEDQEEDRDLMDDARQRITEYWDKCFDLLDDFREHLYHLDIYIGGGSSTEMTDAVFYIILQKCLCRLPNLRSVTIGGNLGLFCCAFQLTEARKNFPLPNLYYLEAFSIEIEDLPKKFELEIYRAYGTQVKKMRLMESLLKPEYTPNPVVNFTQLHVHHLQSPHHNPMEGHRLHKILSRLSFPNLEKLTLDIVELQAPSVHEILQKCPRLSWLSIKCVKPIQSWILLPESASSDIWKKHVALQWLEVKDTIVGSWVFLGCLPGLRYLRIWELDCLASLLQPGKGAYDEPPAVEAVNCSHLWSVVPCLEKLIFTEEGDEMNRNTVYLRPCQNN